MAERSSYQERIIKNYYKNKDAIGLQRLSELVTELYLAEGKKREKVWEQLAAAMEKLEVKPERIAHLRAKDNPELVAKLVEEIMGGQK